MQIFQKDIAQTKWEYKVALVTVSLFTYLVALVSIIAIDWKGFNHRALRWWAILIGLWASISSGWEPAKKKCMRFWTDTRLKPAQFFIYKLASGELARHDGPDDDKPLGEKTEQRENHGVDKVSSSRENATRDNLEAASGAQGPDATAQSGPETRNSGPDPREGDLEMGLR